MTQDFKVIEKRNKATVRYKYVIFPFTTGELLTALARTNLGYILAPPPRTPSPPIGATFDWSGQVAKKGDVFLTFDSATQVIGVEGREPHESINVLLEVLDIVKTTLESTLEEHAQFYEFISGYTIETGKNPLDKLKQIVPEGALYDKIKNIINEDVTTYALHICFPNNKVEDTDWFDLDIRPTTGKSTKTFNVMVVYRNKDKSKVEKFVSNYDDYIRRIFTEANLI